MKTLTDANQRKGALVAGVAIVIMAMAAVLANDLSINKLVVPDDATETMGNIMAHEMLFRTGIFAWFTILVCDALAAWGLYLFFRSVNENLSLLMAWFRIIYVAILGTSIVNLLNVLPLISDPGYLSVNGTEQLASQVLFYINAFNQDWSLGLMVFGIHILFVGYLLLKSGFRVKIMGVILILAFAGYVINNALKLLLPQLETLIQTMEWIFLLPMLVEIVLGIWLLVISIERNTGNKPTGV